MHHFLCLLRPQLFKNFGALPVMCSPGSQLKWLRLEVDWNAFQLPSLLVDSVQMCPQLEFNPDRFVSPLPGNRSRRGPAANCPGAEGPTLSTVDKDYGFLKPSLLCDRLLQSDY